MACFLRAWGRDFAVDAFVARSRLKWDPVWRRGEPRPETRAGRPPRRQNSGLAVLAGAGEDLAAQVAGVTAFLADNRDEVARLLAFPGVEGACLDFGIRWPEDLPARVLRFPPPLLDTVGEMGLHLDVSLHRAGEAQESPPE